MPRRIRIANAREGFTVDRAAVRKVFAALDRHAPWKCPPGELSLAFVDDAEIVRLHDEFLDDPTVTDVITFPGDDAATPGDDEAFAGEICVCVDRAVSEAPKHGFTPDDELTLYLVHGWLHLAGHDDLSDVPRAAMREAEKVCLALLRDRSLMPEYGFPAANRVSPKQKNVTGKR